MRRAAKPEARAYLMPLLIIAVCALVGVVASCTRAQAQQPLACNDRHSIVQQLWENFGETPRGVGLTGDGRVIELFASDLGSWTLLLSLPNGQTCMMASGHGWESMEPRKGRAARYRTAQDGRWERPET